jgi:hypothetical protein
VMSLSDTDEVFSLEENGKMNFGISDTSFFSSDMKSAVGILTFSFYLNLSFVL